MQNLCSETGWAYIKRKENPADIATKVLQANKLI